MANNLLETDMSNILDSKFKPTIIRILPVLEKSIEDTKKSITPNIKELKTNQAEMINVYSISKIDWIQ